MSIAADAERLINAATMDMSHIDATTDVSHGVPHTIGGIFGKTDHDRFMTPHLNEHVDEIFPETCQGKHRVLFETGIDALASILREFVSTREPFRLWVPENFCRESLDRLQRKLDRHIEFAISRIDDNFNQIGRDDVVLYLHFNRFDPSSKTLIESIKRQSQAIVIEDYVHAPLDITRFSGDYAFNSLRKLTSLDVSIAYGDRFSQASSHESKYRQFRKQAETTRDQFNLAASDELEMQFLKLAHQSESALAVREVFAAHPTEIDRMRRFDFKTVQNLRRSNYSRLASQLKTRIPTINILPGGYMYLMIDSPDRDQIRQRLFQQRIFPVIHWADSESEQSKSLLSFHIDQRYSMEQMDHVARTIERLFS